MPSWRNFQKPVKLLRWPRPGEHGYQVLSLSPLLPNRTRMYRRFGGVYALAALRSLAARDLQYVWAIQETYVSNADVPHYAAQTNPNASYVWSVTPFDYATLPEIYEE